LLDSVLLGPGGASCITRVSADLVIVGHTGNLPAALAAVPARRAPIDVAALVDRTGREAASGLLAVAPADPSLGSAVHSLPVRERAPLVVGAVVRTLAVGPTGAAVVTVRVTTSTTLLLFGLDTDVDLVVGAPLLDDGNRLVGIVAPRSWTGAAAAVGPALLDDVKRLLWDRPRMSQQLLHVRRNRDSYVGQMQSLEVTGNGIEGSGRTATSMWLAARGVDGSGVLVGRLHHVEPRSLLGAFRRRLRGSQPESLPINDATALLDALGAAVDTTRLLDEDEARLVEAFVAGLARPAGPPGAPAVSIGAGGPAARVGDPTGHPGVVAPPGVPNVLIGGLPAATVATAQHVCSFPPPSMHPVTTFVSASGTVLIGGSPALRVGDMAGCGAPILPPACPTVLIHG
jgi:uncharacterized Zn-binding protein involved in type VI secretion